MCGVRSDSAVAPRISGIYPADDVMEDVAIAEYSITSVMDMTTLGFLELGQYKELLIALFVISTFCVFIVSLYLNQQRFLE